MSFNMNKNRIEAFSDGVIAIIITIMVLEIHIPEIKNSSNDSDAWHALLHILPKITAYLLSFIIVGIMWLNHHFLFDKIAQVNSTLIWHNMLLLFSMSLIPLPTAFLASHLLLKQASMFYAFIMFLNALAFYLLRRYVEVKAQLIPYNKVLHKSNLISTSLYLAAVPAALISVYLSFIIFIGIPIWYFLPEKLHKF